MSKSVKDMITREYQERYEGVRDACVVDLTGLDVERTQRLRTSLREKSMRVQVVKNSLARRAFADSPLEPLGPELEGPCALVVGGNSIIDVAKALVDLADDLGSITLKKAIIDGDPGLLPVEQVSKMKSQADLLGELAMLLGSPGRALAGCLQGPGGRLAGCLKAMAEKEDGPAEQAA